MKKLLLLSAVFFNLLAAVVMAAGQPNVVFILADDMGYGDLGCYGCPDIRTPNIDSLAKQGARLTQFYSNGPECTPTRTGLMTGRYQQRVGGLECAIGLAGVGRYSDAMRLAERHELGLPADQSVLARALKNAGYATAICGKWHLGYESKFLPMHHGFDYFFGPLGGGIDYFTHHEPGGEHMLYLNDRKVQREGYSTDLIAEEACQFVRRTAGKPFLLYVPFNAPHSPFQAPNEKQGEPFTAENFNRGSRATYIKMVERLDDRIGTILRTLEETGASGETLVIFSSDNGGPNHSRNEPLSGRKGSTNEGGIRVPCIFRWPGKLQAGSESSQVGITMDLTASILNVTGGKPLAGHPLDGIDLIEHVRQQRPNASRTLFWRQQRGENVWRGVRAGDLKLVARDNSGQKEEWMFDLSKDVAEKYDLSKSQASELKRLQGLLARWEEDVKPNR